MITREPKFFVDYGVIKFNPAYFTQNFPSNTNPNALTIVSSMDDLVQCSVPVTPSTSNSVSSVQNPNFTNQFVPGMASHVVIDGISQVFAQYEAPIGLLTKVLPLRNYRLLDFIIDDNSHMNDRTNLKMYESEYKEFIKARRDAEKRYDMQHYSGKELDHVLKELDDPRLSCWEEAEDRIHTMIDLLAYIPVDVYIHFLNRPESIVLSHAGKTPDQFALEAHQRVLDFFSNRPNGNGSLYSKLSEAFTTRRDPNNYAIKMVHYLFTNGKAPSKEISRLICERDGINHPVVLNTCSAGTVEWFDKLDKDAKFVAEMDDFFTEQRQVTKMQGKTFPYTKGFYLAGLLAGAIDQDLDSMDEEAPYTKKQINDLFGRLFSDTEYAKYFHSQPYKKTYEKYENEFRREDTTNAEICMRYGITRTTKHPFWDKLSAQVHNTATHVTEKLNKLNL